MYTQLSTRSFFGFLALISVAFVLLSGCAESSPGEKESTASEKNATKETVAERDEYDIAVFIPGAVAGSPLYKKLADGAGSAADEYDFATAKIIEGGFNQGEWQDKVTELAASGKYELIVSSNPALPEICRRVSERFPDQKFLLFDGYLEGNEQIFTFRYNQREQAFLAGHLAGLITTAASGPPTPSESSGSGQSSNSEGEAETELTGANSALKIGLIAGQEYPDMNNAILPGYTKGAQRVNENIEVDFRVVGNWYDASKAGELAKKMIAGGVDVILPIAGGANQGALKASKEADTYLVWYDSNGYEKAPGRVLGSTAILQEKAAYEKTKEAIEGTLPFGKGEIVGVQEGWITFLADDPHYKKYVPRELRHRQEKLIKEMEKGEVKLPLHSSPEGPSSGSE